MYLQNLCKFCVGVARIPGFTSNFYKATHCDTPHVNLMKFQIETLLYKSHFKHISSSLGGLFQSSNASLSATSLFLLPLSSSLLSLSYSFILMTKLWRIKEKRDGQNKKTSFYLLHWVSRYLHWFALHLEECIFFGLQSYWFGPLKICSSLHHSHLYFAIFFLLLM